MNRPVLSRIGRVSPGRLALAGLFVGLLVVAAGLRFYDLPGNSLSHDEAAAANISRGALSEVIPGTRQGNSSPILYPLTLWVVQQVASTPFSVRLLPAAASVLTVAAMLFLLPRLGVNRWAAFLAALLATLSVAAIENAQDAREYSLDALLAALLIAGLLWYLRDGKKILLCVALFLAPLLQYGLALFGVAVLITAIILPSTTPSFPASAGNSALNRVRNLLKARLALVGPAGCFLAGCVLSYAVTLRYQWRFGPDSYLAAYYYQGKFDAPAIFEFSINGIWRLLTYHLPEGVAIAALVALAIFLVATLFRKVQGKLAERAIAVLFPLCLAISVGAALLGLYPLGDTRQVIYLGPLVFLAVGVALHCTAESLAGLTRRGWLTWLTPALVVAVAGVIALAGVGDLRQDSPYRTDENIKSVLAILEERVREDDLVYAGRRVVPALRFYQEAERPANYYSNYYYGNASCHGSAELCLRDLADLDYWLDVGKGRIWLVTYNRSTALVNNLRGLSVERLGGGKKPELYLIANSNELIAKAREKMLPPEPILLIRSDFDVYLSENTLVYIKQPCAPADLKARFFLHLYPVDGADLPATRQQHGFDNLDFRFDRHGGIINGKCMAARTLPEYAINRIHTGQYVPVGGGFERLWEGEFLYNGAE